MKFRSSVSIFFRWLVLFLLLTGGNLFAANWLITNPTDNNVFGTLRFAINNYIANDVIQFDPALKGQTISLVNGEMAINKNLTIIGLGATNLAIVNDSGRVFNVFNGPLVASISGLKLTGILKGARGLDGTLAANNGTSGTGVTGGCIQNELNCELTVSNCFFVNCQAVGGDGGHGFIDDLKGLIANGGNGGSAAGGAVCNNQGDVFLSNCTFANCLAAGGRGGNGYYGGNGGIGGEVLGGALADVYGMNDVYVVNCTFCGNSAAAGDGGDAGNAWSLLDGVGNGGNGGNGGSARGGGIYFFQGCPVPMCTGIVHCTIDTNQIAPGQGKHGGLGVHGGGPGADGVNGVAQGGGLFAPGAGFLPINNTVVAQDYATFHFTTGVITLAGPDVYHNVVSSKYNFIGQLDGTSAGWIAGFDLVGGVTAPLNPLLGPLQLNGGEIPTQAPFICSPLIDKGNASVAEDQIHQVRPKSITPPPFLGDGSDIGAFELQSVPTNKPTMSLVQSTNQITISWPYAFNCFLLQENSNLQTTNWSAVTNYVSLIGNQCQVTIAPLIGNRFYRLVYQ